MLDIILITFGIVASSWSIYNSVLGIVGVLWRRNYEEKDFSGVSFSLIIPAKNEEKVLPRLLDRLVNQEYDKSKLEIIVVEDGSTDSTIEVCERYMQRYEFIKCIHLEPSNVPNGKSRALNFALKIARGEVIGIFDADTVPKLDNLSYIASKFKDERVVAVQGMLLPINVKESIISRFAGLEELIYEYSIAGRARLGFFVPLEGTVTFIRKEILEKLGGFNEYSLTEDLDLSLKLVANGHKIVYSPSAVAWREVPTSLRTLIRQRLRWYRGHLEIRIGKGKVDWRVVDGMLIVATPIFVVMNAINYSLAIFFPNFIVIIAALVSGIASLFSLVLVILISRIHMIEVFYSFLTFFYFNLVLGLNMTAIIMEVIRYPRFWIKTERSGGVTV